MLGDLALEEIRVGKQADLTDLNAERLEQFIDLSIRVLTAQHHFHRQSVRLLFILAAITIFIAPTSFLLRVTVFTAIFVRLSRFLAPTKFRNDLCFYIDIEGGTKAFT